MQGSSCPAERGSRVNLLRQRLCDLPKPRSAYLFSGDSSENLPWSLEGLSELIHTVWSLLIPVTLGTGGRSSLNIQLSRLLNWRFFPLILFLFVYMLLVTQGRVEVPFEIGVFVLKSPMSRVWYTH